VTTTWPDVLDAFEARLDFAEAVLELHDGVVGPAPFTAPAVAGPVPERLHARATELLARAAAVQHRLEREQDRIRIELARLPRAPPAEDARGGRFDVEG
jgi:hypothetical protein